MPSNISDPGLGSAIASLSGHDSLPYLGSVIYREALQKKLQLCVRGKVTWVNAVAGAGKTTLVSQFLASPFRPHIWFQLEKEDADPVSFFDRLIKKSVGLIGQGKMAHIYNPQMHPDIEEFSRVYFSAYFSLLPPECVIVLDDFHRVENEDILSLILDVALSKVGVGQHIIVISRDIPPPTIAPRISAADATSLSDIQFRVTRAELARLLVMHEIDELSSKEIDSLLHASRGWITGISLILDNYRQSGELATNFRGNQNEFLFNYLSGLLLNRFTEEDKRRLTILASSSFFDKSMVDIVGGDSEFWLAITDMAKRNLFIAQSKSSADRYEYHHLLREFLLRKAHQYHSGDDAREIYREIAGYLQTQDYIDDAADLYIQYQIRDELILLIEKKGLDLVQSGRYQTLLTWIVALPDETVRNSARLTFLQGRSQFPTNPVVGLELLKSAFELACEQADDLLFAQCWASYVNSSVFLLSDAGGPGQYLAVVDQRFSGGLSHVSPDIAVCLIEGVVSIKAMLGFSDEDYDKYISLAENLLYSSENINYFTSLFRPLSTACSYHGRPDRIRRLNQHLLSRHRAGELLPYAQLFMAINLIEEGHFKPISVRADERLKFLEDICEKHAISCANHYIDVSRIFNRLLVNDSDGTREMIEEYAANSNLSLPVMRSSYYFLRGWLALQQGAYSQALSDSTAATDVMGEFNSAPVLITLNILGGAAAVELGLLDVAREHLQQLEAWVGRETIYDIEAGYLRAHIAISRGDHVEARESLGPALDLAERLDIGQMVGMCHHVRASLLCYALRHGINVSFCRRLIADLALLPPKQCLEERWPWPVRIYFNGGIRIFVNDEELKFAKKAPKKSLDLLMAMIARGGINVPLYQLAEDLWPDADGDESHNALNTTLYRLRGILGKHSIVISNSTASFNQTECWVNVLAINACVDGLKELIRKNRWSAQDELEAVAYAMDLVHLYSQKLDIAVDSYGWLYRFSEAFHVSVMSVLDVVLGRLSDRLAAESRERLADAVGTIGT